MKRFFLALLSGGLVFFAAMAAASAYDPLCPDMTTTQADGTTQVVKGWQGGKCVNPNAPCALTPDSAVCKQDKAQQAGNENPIAGPHGVLQEATNLIAAVAGIVAVIMIIISGLQFITAGGSIGGQRAGDNPSRAKKARATLASAVIGLVIVALSWTIASFIIQKFIE